MAFTIEYEGDDGEDIMLATLRTCLGQVVRVTYETGAPAWHDETGDFVLASEYPGEVFVLYPWDDASGGPNEKADPRMLRPAVIRELHIY